MSPAELSTNIVEKFADWTEFWFIPSADYTWTAINLEELANLTAKFDDFGRELEEKVDAYETEIIGIISLYTEKYADPWWVDLYNFTSCVYERITDSAIRNSAFQVISQYPSVLIDMRCSESHKNSHGLSIFCPNNPFVFKYYRGLYKTTRWATSTSWGDFLDHVHTVGVKVGNWIQYGHFAIEGNLTDPGLEFWEEIESVNLTITHVSGPVVSGTGVMLLKNGTEEPGFMGFEGDLTYGGPHGGSWGFPYLVAKNLDQGDLIYDSPYWRGYSINETVIRDYAGALREINHLNQTIVQSWSGDYWSYQVNIFWDRESGIMVEYSMEGEYKNQTATYVFTLEFSASKTNMWNKATQENHFIVSVDDQVFPVTVTSNSTISDFNFTRDRKEIKFNVEGYKNTTGFCNASIPISLLGGPYTVEIDNTTILEHYAAPTNGTHSFVYFTYNHSTHIIRITGTTVIPEFPSFLILPLFMIATLLAVIFYKRKQPL